MDSGEDTIGIHIMRIRRPETDYFLKKTMIIHGIRTEIRDEHTRNIQTGTITKHQIGSLVTRYVYNGLFSKSHSNYCFL